MHDNQHVRLRASLFKEKKEVLVRNWDKEIVSTMVLALTHFVEIPRP